MDQKLIDQYMDQLLFAQQGELDAVLMYNKLAEKVKDARDAATFKQLAAEEGRLSYHIHFYYLGPSHISKRFVCFFICSFIQSFGISTYYDLC